MCFYCTEQRGRAFLDRVYFNGRCIGAQGWGVGRARQQWRAQAPQFITRTLQGAQLRRQNQRVGGTGEEEKRGGWQRWGTDGVDRVGVREKSSSAWEDKGFRGVRGRHRRDKMGDMMWETLSVSSFVPTARSVTEFSHPSSLVSTHSSKGESLDWVPLVFFTCLFDYCSLWCFRCSQSSPMSYCTFLPRGCHAVDPLQEGLFGKFCGAIARIIQAEGVFRHVGSSTAVEM